MKKYLIILGAICVIMFSIWFIPLFYTGITISDEEQSCRLNKKIAQKEYYCVISNFGERTGGNSFIKFEFTDESFTYCPNWYFGDSLSYINIGDSMIKRKGELEIIIKNDTSSQAFSMDHGCPDWGKEQNNKK